MGLLIQETTNRIYHGHPGLESRKDMRPISLADARKVLEGDAISVTVHGAEPAAAPTSVAASKGKAPPPAELAESNEILDSALAAVDQIQDKAELKTLAAEYQTDFHPNLGLDRAKEAVKKAIRASFAAQAAGQ
jgi:hypothetical protein